jgi:hypothetical protein
MEYILGCPSFGRVLEDLKEFYAPVSQIGLCRDVLREIKSNKDCLTKIQKEYFAIFFALLEMEIDFSITCHETEKEYRQDIEDSLREIEKEFEIGFEIGIIDLPDNFPVGIASFPKDIFTILAEDVLVNPEIIIAKPESKNIHKVSSSLYGEGGRVLHRGNTILVSEHLTLGKHRPLEEAKIEALNQMEINLGLFPLPISSIFSLSKKGKLIPNDHLDRVSCLVEGKDKKLYLVVDPNICTLEKDENKNWVVQNSEKSLEKIGIICQQLGIELCYPEEMEVPYALNLFQFENGKILMTGGDDSIYQIIAEIAGEEMVTKTEVPIQLYPIFNNAGIGCLINNSFPPTLLKANTLIV